MIHIAIDTNGIVGHDRSLKSANFQALKRLIENAKLKIHVPYIVKRELETQQKAFYLDFYKEFEKNLNKFKKAPKTQDVYDLFNNFKNDFSNLVKNIDQDSDDFSETLLTELNCQVYEIDQQQAKAAFEAYFTGTAPLTRTSPKNRDDIPDSFICRSFEKIKESVDNLILITADGKIVNTFKDKENYKIFSNISEFIQSTTIQEILEELDTITGKSIVQGKIGNLVGFIKEYESITSLMESFLEDKIGEKILYANIYDIPLSNDIDGEACINSYNNGENIKIDLDNPIHYGDNQIGYNFELEVEVEVDYFVNKFDYYTEFYAGQNLASNISVEDWNDHVFHAESDVCLRVTGIVSITINTSNVDFPEIAKCDPDDLDDHLHDLYSESIINIESIGEIEPI